MLLERHNPLVPKQNSNIVILAIKKQPLQPKRINITFMKYCNWRVNVLRLITKFRVCTLEMRYQNVVLKNVTGIVNDTRRRFEGSGLRGYRSVLDENSKKQS